MRVSGDEPGALGIAGNLSKIVASFWVSLQGGLHQGGLYITIAK